ncbi:MAG TPA: DUF4175 family protein, partial [Flavobacteriaceae bacterium]|nr:DUF4175 family protein [Flavobacteriaceae bacterium]
MNSYTHIKQKLETFTKRYYINELVKGAILFISLGFLYLLFTLTIEFFLWLKPLARTFLFWLFIAVELGLLIKFIVLPLIKLIGLKKGLSQHEAAKIIGNHFPEVEDKLLNVIQLKQLNLNTELIEASIQQKSIELKPIPFKNAIQFSTNKKYLKYAILPIFIYLIIWLTGNYNFFNQSFDRVVKFNTQFEQPAPFQFKINNNSLEVIQGKKFELFVETVGNVVPNDAKIYFGEEKYYLNKIDIGKFSYQFDNIQKPTTFVLEANGVVSKNYTLNVINAPLINSLRLVLKYPKYISKKNEIINNTGNVIVPEGTLINWQITTANTSTIQFASNGNSDNFNKTSANYFSYEKQAKNSFSYQIASSNTDLINYEKLNFEIDVIKDEYPKIAVETDLNEVLTPPFQFAGQLSDDYGVSALNFVITNSSNKSDIKKIQIPINKTNVTDFYYEFNNTEALKEGVNYNFYFEVFDNDAVNGRKRTKSKIFSFYNNTKTELRKEILENQQKNIDNLSNTLKNIEENNSELQNIENILQQKSNFNWNDANKLEDLLKRQQQYQQLINTQSKRLNEDIEKQPNLEKTSFKKEALQQRLNDLNNFEKQNALLKELEQLMQQLDKNNLSEKLKELSKKN